MRVEIYTDDGLRGMVWYTESDHQVMVTFPEPHVRQRISAYLRQQRGFRVPASPDSTGDMNIIKRATDEEFFMNMALCEMYYSIGVHVDWGTENHGNTVVIPSVDGEEEYEIEDHERG